MIFAPVEWFRFLNVQGTEKLEKNMGGSLVNLPIFQNEKNAKR
jgi:hypothetical protein